MNEEKMEIQITYAMVKPFNEDYLKNENCPNTQIEMVKELISTAEKYGIKVVMDDLVNYSKADAEEHYKDKKGKNFFGDLVNYISGNKPAYGICFIGVNAVDIIRNIATALRAKYNLEPKSTHNGFHSSDSVENAKAELKLFYSMICRKKEVSEVLDKSKKSIANYYSNLDEEIKGYLDIEQSKQSVKDFLLDIKNNNVNTGLGD